MEGAQRVHRGCIENASHRNSSSILLPPLAKVFTATRAPFQRPSRTSPNAPAARRRSTSFKAACAAFRLRRGRDCAALGAHTQALHPTTAALGQSSAELCVGMRLRSSSSCVGLQACETACELATVAVRASPKHALQLQMLPFQLKVVLHDFLFLPPQLGRVELRGHRPGVQRRSEVSITRVNECEETAGPGSSHAAAASTKRRCRVMAQRCQRGVGREGNRHRNQSKGITPESLR